MIFEGRYLEDKEVANALEELETEIKEKQIYDPCMRITAQSRACQMKPDCANKGVACVAIRYREFVVMCRGCLQEHLRKMTLYVLV